MQTRNVSLQQTLSSWVDMINNIMTSLPSPSIDRNNAIINFVRSFVSFDIEEDDIQHFSNTLINDEEFFQSLYRELKYCSTGDLIEKITDNQINRAAFIILPDESMLSENSTLDIVREVAFISLDKGLTWRAEG